MKYRILLTLLFGLLVSFSGYVAAEGEGSLEENAENLEKAIGLTEGAIELAKQGDAKATSKAINETIEVLKHIVSFTWSRKIDGAGEKLRLGDYISKRIMKGKPKATDNMEKVVSYLEDARERLKVVQTIKP